MSEEEDPLSPALAPVNCSRRSTILTTAYASVRAACAGWRSTSLRKTRASTAALREALTVFVRTDDPRGESGDDLRFEAAITLCEANDPNAAILSEALGESKRRFDALKALYRTFRQTLPAGRQSRKRFQKMVLVLAGSFGGGRRRSRDGEAQGEAFFEKTLTRSDGPMYRRALAVYLLGDLRMANAFERLTKIAEDESDAARGGTAIRAIGHLQDPRSLEWLQRDWPGAFRR